MSTLYNFVESGAVRIPGFQRNFVWDLARSSKLIESLILGLPVPQIFLYEQARNRFLVIDGQQRLLSIYYFIKKRFPRVAVDVALLRAIPAVPGEWFVSGLVYDVATGFVEIVVPPARILGAVDEPIGVTS